jgi:hypothetical protein
MCVCRPEVKSPWCGRPGCEQPASQPYTWCRCEGCGDEFNGSDPALKEKHRYCVANRAKENRMPLSEGTKITPSASTAALHPITGLVGPKDLLVEDWREYDFVGEDGKPRVYRINHPIAFYYREGGTTHRVVTAGGVVHCVPAPGHSGCVLRWKNKDVNDPVTY